MTSPWVVRRWALPGVRARSLLLLSALCASPAFAQAHDPRLERERNIEALHREAVERKEHELGPAHPATATALRDLGLLLLDRGQAEEAARHLSRALRARESAADADGLELARDAFGLAQALQRTGNEVESELLCERALRLLREAGQPDPGLGREALSLHASLAHRRGDLREAAERYQAVVEAGPDPGTMLILADIYERLAAPEMARAALEEAVRIGESPGMPLHPRTGEALHRLGLIAADATDFEGARRLLERALEAFARTTGSETAEAASAADTLGNVMRATGDMEAAEKALAGALELRARLLGPRHPGVAASANNLAGVHHMAGRLDRAEPLYLQAVEILAANFGEADARLAETLFSLGYLRAARGRHAEAAAAFRRVLAILDNIGETESPLALDARAALASVTAQ